MEHTCQICGHPQAGLGASYEDIILGTRIFPNRAGFILRMRECHSCHKLLFREDHYWEVRQGESLSYECCGCHGVGLKENQNV